MGPKRQFSATSLYRIGKCRLSGGGGGIRTHETLLGPNGFQDRRSQPLSYPSDAFNSNIESGCGGARLGPDGPPRPAFPFPAARVLIRSRLKFFGPSEFPHSLRCQRCIEV